MSLEPHAPLTNRPQRRACSSHAALPRGLLVSSRHHAMFTRTAAADETQYMTNAIAVPVKKTLLESVLELREPGQNAPPCLGAMNFGRRTEEGESKKIVARALELGIRHIDTANAYGD